MSNRQKVVQQMMAIASARLQEGFEVLNVGRVVSAAAVHLSRQDGSEITEQDIDRAIKAAVIHQAQSIGRILTELPAHLMGAEQAQEIIVPDQRIITPTELAKEVDGVH